MSIDKRPGRMKSERIAVNLSLSEPQRLACSVEAIIFDGPTLRRIYLLEGITNSKKSIEHDGYLMQLPAPQSVGRGIKAGQNRRNALLFQRSICRIYLNPPGPSIRYNPCNPHILADISPPHRSYRLFLNVQGHSSGGERQASSSC